MRNHLNRAGARFERWAIGGTSILIGALGIAATLYQSFSLFLPSDDEGYMMMSVRHLLNGHRLYSDVEVFYGPLYYLEKWLLHRWLAFPLTHETVRLTSLATRVATAAVGAIAVTRIAKSSIAGVVAFYALTAQQIPLALEPGHPQDLGLLIAVAMPLCASFESRDSRSALVLLGVLGASMMMVKVNLGVFAIVSIGAAISTTAQLPRLLTPIVRVIPAFLPWALVRGHDSWLYFAGLVTAWILGLLPWKRSVPVRVGSLVVPVCVGFTGGLVLLTLCALALGASLGDALRMLVVEPRRFFGQLPAMHLAIPRVGAWTLLGVAASFWCGLRQRPETARGRWLVMAVVGGATLLPLLRPTEPSNLPYRIGPWAWLLFWSGTSLARTLVAWLTVLFFLQVFPVPGNQVACGGVPAVLCATIVLGDVVEASRTLVGSAGGVRIRRLVSASLLGLTLTAAWSREQYARALYTQGELMALPGTGPMHSAFKGTRELHEMAASIRSRCDVLFTVAGFYSMNFWTDRWPPTLDLVRHGKRPLSDAQIASIAKTLRDAKRPCVLRSRDIWESTTDPRIDEALLSDLHAAGSWAGRTLFVR